MKSFTLFCITLFLLILFSCTENTIFNTNESITDKLSIRGRVTLSDGTTPSGVIVWVKEFDRSVYTDSTGRFTLTFPPPNAQPGAGYNGYVSIYVYVSNYRIVELSALLVDGKVVYGKGDIDMEGSVYKIIELIKLLDIHLSISPSTIPENFADWTHIDLWLKTRIGPVEVETFKYQYDESMFTNVFFKEVGESNENALLWRGSVFIRICEIRGEEQWYFDVHSDSIKLVPGVYEVIPYINILQDGIPKKLIEHFGIISNLYNYTFLNIPIKQSVGYLTVTEPTKNSQK
jgi:hypothetical protein